MTKKVIPGGFYGDATPEGGYAVTVFNSHIEVGSSAPAPMHIPLPHGQNLLYLVVAPDGGYAGVGQHDDHCWEWGGIDQGWQDRGIAFGQNPLIYDALGNLHIVRGPGTETGSQGWRAFDGYFITSDRTHLDSALDLSDYTPLAGGLAIGQSHDNNQDDAIVWIDGTRRLLEPGPCRFIRVHEAGGVYAITLVKLQGGQTVIYWLTRAELAALPLANRVVVPPPPPPPPPPEPPMVPVSELRRLASALRAHASLLVLHQPSFPFCVAVAKSLGGKWGLNGKRGNRSDPSRDVVTYLDDATVVHLYDVVGAAFDPANPTDPSERNQIQIPGETDQGEQHPNGDGGVWLDPAGFAGPAQPPPVDPPPPAIDLSGLYTRIALLEARIKDIDAHIDAVIDETASKDDLATIRTKLDTLAARVDALTGPTEGPRTIRTEPAGASFLRHTHEVKLP